MTDSRYYALSPLDGRYAGLCADLASLFSEAALIRHRVRVEAAWLLQLAASPHFPTLVKLAPAVRACLVELQAGLDDKGVARVKALEATTRHDVKAVEYFVREQLAAVAAPPALLEMVHFACTSEDINNLSYALMLDEARRSILLPLHGQLTDALSQMAHEHANLAMLSRTHGQAASPTTLGKEMANVALRLARASEGFSRVAVLGKLNGAVGNYNAHVVACPAVDWPTLTQEFIESLGLEQNPLTTQIEPHDWIADYCDALARCNTIQLDLCRDLWGYVSLGYFRQRPVDGEVGSSTMPHKVNPIDFENAEGNLGFATAMLRHFADKLPVSRWQRDLSDSTVMRNLGVALGHCTVASRSLLRGLARIEADAAKMADDLGQHWEVLGEAVQMVLRFHGVPDGYEKLKSFSRGRALNQAQLQEFISGLELPQAVRDRLRALTPADYTGLAASLARGE